MSEAQQQVNKLVKFISRNLRLILVCLLSGLVIGLGVYLYSPKAYQSTALIMFQQQQINPTKMSPDVQNRIKAMVNTVGQQVTSRTNLEELIKTHGLYPEMRQKQPIEDVIEAMRKEITFEARQGGIFASRSGEGDVDVFGVSFAGKDPGQVMRVTNDLASKFVEENIRFREERVTETSAYVQEELEIAKAALDKKDEIMRDYKLKYYNEMPSQRESNIARLNALQDQYQQIQASIQEMERTRLLIQEQISLRQQAQPGSASVGPVEPPLTEIERIRQELETLKLKYTPNHPDVKRLRNRLDTLMAAQEEADKGSPEERATPAMASPGKVGPTSQTVQLELQLKEMEIRLGRLNKEQEAVRDQVEQVQQWVEAAPIREAEWAALTRDYKQLQQHYESLVARSLEAESAETLERRQKGSQFKIIESAHYPEKPFQPDFKKIILMAAGIGLGIGAALAYILEFTDTSFRDVTDVETYLGLKVNCAIPVLPTAREQFRQKLRTIAWATVLLTGYLLLGGSMLVLWQRGVIII